MIPIYTITRKTKVVDEFGTPIQRAHVYFSQNEGTTTNTQGEAFITGMPGQTVTVSFMGYGSMRFPLKDLPETITLKMQANQMDEVIVTGTPKPKKTAPVTPKYLWPAIGGVAALLILMSIGSEPKKVTL